MNTGVTPNRKTHLRISSSETVTVEPPFAIYRAGWEIARGGVAPSGSVGIQLLGSGAFALEPLQERMNFLQERTDNAGAALGLADFQTIDGYRERNVWRAPSDLTGMTVGPNVAASGDAMMVRGVAAGSWWNASLAADIAAFGQAPLPTANIPMDRHAVGFAVQSEDQAYLVRFTVPGTLLHTPDVLAVFYFGGPLDDQSTGSWALAFTGDGLCMLYEMLADGAPLRDSWRFAEPHRMGELAVSMRVWPHLSPSNGGYIEFRCGTGDIAPPVAALLTSYYTPASQSRAHLYRVPPGRNSGYVSGAGPVRVDIRRDLRALEWQISLLRFPVGGALRDYPFSLPFYATQRSLLTIAWEASIPDGCSLIGRLIDLATGLEPALVESGSNYRSYQIVAGNAIYAPEFDFTSDSGQAGTSLLWNYRVLRDPWLQTAAPGEIVVPETAAGAAVRSVNISGPERDASHETAFVSLEDPAAQLAPLNIRAGIRARIETEYDPIHPENRSVLFDGYIARADGDWKGTYSAGGAAGFGPARLFPAPDWRSFRLTLMGMWQRLQEALTLFRLPLSPDSDAPIDPDGTQPAFKVTDILRALLLYAGFGPDQVDIADSPIRFEGGGAESGDALIIDPLANIFEGFVRYAREYLGAFLVWDGNAGSAGMWRLLAFPAAPYPVLADFTADAPVGKLPHRPESYSTTAADWVGVRPTGFVRRSSLRTVVRPPEANAVCVTGAGEPLPGNAGQFRYANWAVNPVSYDFYTGTGGSAFVSSDPSNPDYLGRFVPLVIVDPGHCTQHAVDIATRRYYDLHCHARQIASFEAPLLLITDPADTLQSTPRPLRYGDGVTLTIDGVTTDWLIRCVNPRFTRDSMQLALYELEAGAN